MKSKVFFHALPLVLILAVGACGKKASQKEATEPGVSHSQSVESLNLTTTRALIDSLALDDEKAIIATLKENPNYDLNTTIFNVNGETLLTLAIKKDFQALRDFLVERGAATDLPNGLAETPLMASVNTHQENSFHTLLDLKVDLNRKGPKGNTSLHIAIIMGFSDFAMELIKRGANIDITNDENETALRLAEKNNQPEVLELLRSKTPTAYRIPEIGSYRSVLIKGDTLGLKEMIQKNPELIQVYAYINPLVVIFAASDDNAVRTNAELLLDKGAAVDGFNGADTTPLIRAIRAKREGMVQLFMDRGAEVNIIDKEGMSPLWHAILINESSIVDLLMRNNPLEKYEYNQYGFNRVFKACTKVKEKFKSLKTPTDIQQSKKIQRILNC